MINFPVCKINLGLSILERRMDGFHNIETVMYPIPLYDVLEIMPSGSFDFCTSGNLVPGPPDQNLVVKAFKLLRELHKIGPVKIHLHKNIPSGAGLGGGSSDGAHALILLNHIFNLNLSTARMEAYARTLGSDCAFFIRSKPVYASEKGDQLQPLAIDLSPYNILVVKPELHINTSNAYALINPAHKVNSVLETIDLPLNHWNGKLINDFEAPIFSSHPPLEQLKTKIRNKGAVYTSMTGSGSAIFGIFEKSANLPAAHDFPGCFVWSSHKDQSPGS